MKQEKLKLSAEVKLSIKNSVSMLTDSRNVCALHHTVKARTIIKIVKARTIIKIVVILALLTQGYCIAAVGSIFFSRRFVPC